MGQVRLVHVHETYSVLSSVQTGIVATGSVMKVRTVRNLCHSV